jgi:hypothetical protein
MSINGEIINESIERIKIVKMKKKKKPSSYTGGYYTLALIVDQFDRRIDAAGKWVENWQEGDEVEGILQEKASLTAGHKEAFVASHLYLKNPQSRY